MNDTQLTAIIVGITGIIRTRLPNIDGIVVPAVAMGIGAALAALGDPEHWREALVHGVGVALAAVGGMTAIGYAGTKVGEAIGAANTDTADATTPPAATPPAPTSPTAPSTPTSSPSEPATPAAHA
jgi:hypothetical protein